MLSLVNSVETQYRQDVAQRDRERALMASIRENLEARRRAARSAGAAGSGHPGTGTAPAPKAAWARPIGVRLAADADPRMTGACVA